MYENIFIPLAAMSLARSGHVLRMISIWMSLKWMVIACFPSLPTSTTSPPLPLSFVFLLLFSSTWTLLLESHPITTTLPFNKQQEPWIFQTRTSTVKRQRQANSKLKRLSKSFHKKSHTSISWNNVHTTNYVFLFAFSCLLFVSSLYFTSKFSSVPVSHIKLSFPLPKHSLQFR